MTLNQPIESFRFIGPIYLKRLHKLGIKTLEDLFYHFPFRYDNFSNLKKINELKIGEEATIEGEIKKIGTWRTPRRKMFLTEVLISDGAGDIKAVWFNQPYLAKTLKTGTRASFAGKVKEAKNGIFLSSPAYEKIKENEQQATDDRQQSPVASCQSPGLIHTQGLVPVYPETEGLSSRWLRFIIHPLLQEYIEKIEEFLPEEILKNKNFPERKKALFEIHFPKIKKEAETAKKRFAFEELFLIQLFFQEEKNKFRKQKALRITPKIEYIKEFKKNLPFLFTADQKKVIREILDDMQKDSPMSRLLEGEVGSGKTIVATLAAFIAAKNGYQTVIMAPTEILAEQHFKEISKILSGFNIKIGLLTSENSMLYPREILISGNESGRIPEKGFIEMAKNGKIDILIGTHSLIQERVKFKNLALVVVDEQHRFGVEQRAKLCQQTKNSKQQTTFIPHFLSMTATPIPRTLALALYGDLSVSQIKELPKGRKKIITEVVPRKNRNQVYGFLRKEVNDGRQGFVICPLIEESKKLARPSQKTGFGFYLSFGEIAAAKREFKKLKEKIFPDLKLGLLHGKMKQEEKEKIMKDFKEGEIQILVSTPVVEVGIDVPNATVMLIEGADRFGLSQLYQFRGRVGRGEFQSYCFLFTESPAKRTMQRLRAIEIAENAFELAEKDLQIRGPGDFAGTRQAGIPDLAMASLSDSSLIEDVKKEVEKILEKDSELKNYPLLKKELDEFKQKVFLE